MTTDRGRGPRRRPRHPCPRRRAGRPSFDCAKASSRAEKTICDVPELAWQDRQMGKATKGALAAVGKLARPIRKPGRRHS